MKLTVVIPAGRVSGHLARTLDGLAAQRGSFEVLVVDNTADAAVVAQLRDRRALRVVHEPAPGVSSARNRGVAEAQGDAILFLNDDTAPLGPELVAKHLTALEEGGAGTAVMGHIRYTAELLRDPFMRFLGEHAQFTYEDLSPGAVTRAGRVYTAHLSLWKRDFELAGGFDERLTFGFEDAEFAHRLMGAGVSVEYRPDLATEHDHPMTLSGWARRAERMGAAGARVNGLSDASPPLAPVPSGPYWTALAAGARLIEAIPAPYARLPAAVRRGVYVVLNQGAYARGYRAA